MFKRQVSLELIKWKLSTNRKPLILRGARQVGKTSLVDQFSSNYSQYIYVNLEVDSAIFIENKKIEQLVEAIFFLKQKDISQIQDTLVFIDEIQEVPEAINMLRYFYEKYPKLHVIAAGSLLETLLTENTKFPVGRVEFLVIHPFSFSEYLEAINEINMLEALHGLETKPYATDILFDHFHKYTLIGGMPEVIKSYVENKNLSALVPIYSDLLYAYQNDIPKYARNNTLAQVMRHCLQQLFYYGGKRIAYTNFGNSNYKAREVGEALQTLERAMLLSLIFPFTNYHIPVSLNFRKRPKLLLLDTGLMNHFAGLQREIIGTSDISELYAGQVAEQIVGQEMASNFKSPLEKNHYWVSENVGSDAEVDFVIQYENLLIPIEVKSGKVGKLKSLLQFMEYSKQPIAVRLYRGAINVHKVLTPEGHEFTLINLPYFLAAYIKVYVDKVLNNVI